jgi:GT2 family glycosyltransferase
VRLIRNSENRGFCAANNQGFAAAEGELIALLNNDAEAEPCWLAALAKAFSGGSRVGMAASKILVHGDPTRIDKAGHLMYPDGQNRGRGTGETDYGQYDRQQETIWPDGCAAMYRKEMLERIGGFDEDFSLMAMMPNLVYELGLPVGDASMYPMQWCSTGVAPPLV